MALLAAFQHGWAFADDDLFGASELAQLFQLSKTCQNECANESASLTRLALSNGKVGFLITTTNQDFCGSGGCTSAVVIVSGNKFVKLKEGLGITEQEAISVASSGPDATTLASGGPSFDCAKAKSASARLICSDVELSQADKKLGVVFKVLTGRADQVTKKRLIEEQLAWIRNRNTGCQVGPDKAKAPVGQLLVAKACMLSAINDRIRVLGGPHDRPAIQNTQQNADAASTVKPSPGVQPVRPVAAKGNAPISPLYGTLARNFTARVMDCTGTSWLSAGPQHIMFMNFAMPNGVTVAPADLDFLLIEQERNGFFDYIRNSTRMACQERLRKENKPTALPEETHLRFEVTIASKVQSFAGVPLEARYSGAKWMLANQQLLATIQGMKETEKQYVGMYKQQQEQTARIAAEKQAAEENERRRAEQLTTEARRAGKGPVGRWRSNSAVMTISKNGENYMVNIECPGCMGPIGGTFLGPYKDGLIMISSTFGVVTFNENDDLIMYAGFRWSRF